jgi:hypothetical protein
MIDTVELEIPVHLAPAIAILVKTAVQKGSDYARDEWSSNFSDTADHFGIPRYESCDFNEIQKLARLKSLRTGRKVLNESVEDTYRDKALYAILAYVLYLEEVAARRGAENEEKMSGFLYTEAPSESVLDGELPSRAQVSTHMPIEGDGVDAWLQRIRGDFDTDSPQYALLTEMMAKYQRRAEEGKSLSEPVIYPT